jgi:hypothetical protein
MRKLGMGSVPCALLLSATALAVQACGGADAEQPKVVPSMTISAGRTQLEATIGEGSSLSFEIIRGGGFAGSVKLLLEGAPPDVNAFVAPTTLDLSSRFANLTVFPSALAQPIVSHLTVHATGSGVTEQVLPITLIVLERPSFSLGLVTSAVQVVQGGPPVSVTLVVSRVGGFTGGVGLSASAPAGMTVTIRDPALFAISTTITVSAAATLAPGIYSVNVLGESSGIAAQTASLTVTVAAPPP